MDSPEQAKRRVMVVFDETVDAFLKECFNPGVVKRLLRHQSKYAFKRWFAVDGQVFEVAIIPRGRVDE